MRSDAELGFIPRDVIAPAVHQTPEVPAAELLVAHDGSYRLDDKPVMDSALTTAVANLRAAKRGIKIDVIAAPGAPHAAIATALIATRIENIRTTSF